MIEALILILGGLVAGLLGGLLGLGGGIVLMPVLRFVSDLSPAEAAATCVFAVFFTTLGGSYRHYRVGNIEPRSVVPVMVAGLVTAAGCSMLFPFLARRGGWLDLGIGLVFLLVSSRMVFEGISGLARSGEGSPRGPRIEGPLPHKLSIGAAAGALPGLLGIGAGGVLVPAFTFLLKAHIRTAAAASLVCFCCTAAVSAVFKYGQGYVDLFFALPLCLGTFVGANLGALINRRFPSRGLKLLFGLVFTFVSIRFIVSFARTAIG